MQEYVPLSNNIIPNGDFEEPFLEYEYYTAETLIFDCRTNIVSYTGHYSACSRKMDEWYYFLPWITFTLNESGWYLCKVMLLPVLVSLTTRSNVKNTTTTGPSYYEAHVRFYGPESHYGIGVMIDGTTITYDWYTDPVSGVVRNMSYTNKERGWMEVKFEIFLQPGKHELEIKFTSFTFVDDVYLTKMSG
jgi:hypothetical protein